MAGVFHKRANDYYDDYKLPNPPDEVAKLREKTKSNRLKGNVGIGVCAAGAIGFVITIPLGRKGEQE